MTITDNLHDHLHPYHRWEDISWRKIDSEVKNLRCRIFRASQEKNYKKLRPLQKLMINSFSNCLHATRRVTKISRGKKTPGIDDAIYMSNLERFELAREINNMNLRDWFPPAVRREYIPKPDGRQRPLGIPTIKDRVIQAILLNALEPEWEALFEPSSYGFRPGKSYQDASHRIHTLLSKKDRVWIVDADIEGCFDNIDHPYLMSKVQKFPFSILIHRWLKAGMFDQGIFKETEKGTPQGGVISPLLCNIALHGLESDLQIKYDSQGYISKQANPLNRTLIRFADDMLVICPTIEIASRTVTDLNNALKSRGLNLNEKKTKIRSSFEGFDFLGFYFSHKLKRGYEHINIGNTEHGIDPSYRDFISTIVFPSEKSLKNICAKLSHTFQVKYRGRPVRFLIKEVNLILRGYCDSKRTFNFSHAAAHIGHHLFKLQMRWIKRAHPKKSTDWVVKNYFTHYITKNINNKWVFRCPNSKLVCIIPRWYSSKRKWPPVVGSYCPDDPNPVIQKYFVDRRKSLHASRVVDLLSNYDYSLALSQNHICPICDQSLYNDEYLQRHHIIPISLGGPDTLNNLVLVHTHCHHHIHYGNDKEKWIDTLSQYKSKLSTKLVKSPLKYSEIV
jgi:RNA-directed DNA polymerase